MRSGAYHLLRGGQPILIEPQNKSKMSIRVFDNSCKTHSGRHVHQVHKETLWSMKSRNPNHLFPCTK